MPDSLRLVAVINDIHCGSTVALLPPNFVTAEGNDVALNPFQQWLWACWTDATTQWLPGVLGTDPWALVLNGDLVEGCHHGTKQVISPDESDHVTAAEAVLKPLAAGASQVFVTLGTECHVHSRELGIGKALKAIKNPETGKRAFNRLTLDVNGCRCVFRHHISCTVRTYLEATSLSIELAQEQVEAARVGHPIPKVLIAAHRHRFGQYTDAAGMCVVGGPWQGLTRHGHKVVGAAIPKPTIMVLDWRGKDKGDLPQVHARQYAAPAADAIRL